mmetsp:Transcript_6058/g.18290  ORF Transcript_6058/g.18290 Transcript_6058/m.18290 type:complete len:139 (-) Transcript_6058:545-961(-)
MTCFRMETAVAVVAAASSPRAVTRRSVSSKPVRAGGRPRVELTTSGACDTDEREFDAARPGERVVVTVEQMASRDGPYEPRRPEEGASTGPVQNAAPRGRKRAPKLGLRKKRMYRGGQTARGTKSKGSKRRKNRGRDP